MAASSRCSVCSKQPDTATGFHCAACARSVLYPARLTLATALLHRQYLCHQVNVTLDHRSGSLPHGADRKLQPSGTPNVHAVSQAMESMRIEVELTQRRSTWITQQHHKLSTYTTLLRERIEARRRDLRTSRQVLNSARSDLALRSEAVTDTLRRAIQKIASRHSIVYTSMRTHRVELCREAMRVARLCKSGLKLDGKVDGEYEIFGIALPNLKDIGKLSPRDLSLALDYFCRFLNLVCQYLQVRLPAEVRLPSALNAYALIFTPAGSYCAKTHAASIGSLGKKHANHKESTSRPMSHARALRLDRPLTHFAREDPRAYALFIEGVALLAWDVAWLCRTQGLSVADSHWEDSCHIGKNLFCMVSDGNAELLDPSYTRLGSTKSEHKQSDSSEGSQVSEKISFLGRYSQGSSFSNKCFLNHRDCDLPSYCSIAEHSWMFGSSTAFSDQVKGYLNTDISGQEWDILEEDEYKRDLVLHQDDDSQHTIATPSRKGWTKLRPRPMSDHTSR